MGQVFQQSRKGPSPQLVSELHVDAPSSSLIPEFPAQLYPQGAATLPGGHLLIGIGMVGACHARMFRIVDRTGRALFQEENYTCAGEVAVTHSGTIFYNTRR